MTMYSLDKNELIALGSAMSFILSDWKNGLPLQIVMEAIYVGDDEISGAIVQKFYKDLSNEDLYNLIWNLQENIYEAMCVGDFE